MHPLQEDGAQVTATTQPSAQDQASLDLMLSIRANPCYYAEEWFGLKPWARQKEILEAPFKYRQTAVGSGHGVGKSEAITTIIPLWLYSHHPAFVVVIAETWDALTSKTFPGLRARIIKGRAIMKAKNLPMGLGEDDKSLPLTEKWELGDRWGAYGRSPDKAEGIQGYHSEGDAGGTLVLVDETSNLTQEVHDGIESYGRDPRNAILYLGNPLRQDGPFSGILRKEPRYKEWHTITISSEETPNVVATKAQRLRDPSDPYYCPPDKEVIVVPGLATFKYVESVERLRGRDSAYFSARILGVPPDQGDETFISRRAVLACGERWKTSDSLRGENGPEKNENSPAVPSLILTCDPAWSDKGDNSVILLIDPALDAVVHVEEHRGWKETRLMNRILALNLEHTIQENRIELDGIGAPLVHRLQDLEKAESIAQIWDVLGPNADLPADFATLKAKLAPVEGIQTGGRPHDSTAYINRRAEMWDSMKRGLKTLSIPPLHLEKFVEMSNIQYLEAGMGKLQIESKRDFKKRGHDSPNYADALALYYARPVGDPLFASVQRKIPDLRLQKRPYLYLPAHSTAPTLHLEGLSQTFDRPGSLCRALWWSRRGTSAFLIVHIDQQGCWTVTHAQSFHMKPLSTIAESLETASLIPTLSHSNAPERIVRAHFRLDLSCASAASAQMGQNLTYNDLLDDTLATLDLQFPHRGRSSRPFPLPESTLSGTAGLDTLDKLISQTPSNSAMLTIYPHDVLQDLKNARFTPQTSHYDAAADLPEEGIGGGGPYTRCLRMIAIQLAVKGWK